MQSRRLFLLLFCAALLAQIGAPLSGAAARAAEHMGFSPRICQILRSSHAALDPAGAPAGTHSHGADCGQCLTTGGDAPLDPTVVALGVGVSYRRAEALFDRSTRAVFPDRLNHSAAPRAPPVIG